MQRAQREQREQREQLSGFCGLWVWPNPVQLVITKNGRISCAVKGSHGRVVQRRGNHPGKRGGVFFRHLGWSH